VSLFGALGHGVYVWTLILSGNDIGCRQKWRMQYKSQCSMCYRAKMTGLTLSVVDAIVPNIQRGLAKLC
jgi:hypothetical protein